jgi:DNA-binding winged helix-turn-helix (wHTH) protein
MFASNLHPLRRSLKPVRRIAPPAAPPPRRLWRAGSLEFDETTRELRVAGERQRIEAKPLHLLLRLLEARGAYVSQHDLFIAAWGNAEVPKLGSLQTAMSKLRKTLGEAERDLIEVATGEGYRITKPVLGPGDAATPAADHGRLRARHLAAAAMLLGVAATGAAAIEAQRAQREHEGLQAVFEFVSQDVLWPLHPGVSGKPNETLSEALADAAPRIGERLANQPLLAAPLYASLAISLDARSDFPAARAAYAQAEAAYLAGEGASSPNRLMLRLRRAAMEARATTPGSLETARALVAEATPRIATLGDRQREAEAWQLQANGMIANIDGKVADALDDFAQCWRIAQTLPGAFDDATQFQMRHNLAFAEMKTGDWAAARRDFTTLADSETAAHGKQHPFTLKARIGLALTLHLSGDFAPAVALLNELVPAAQSVFGPADHITLVAQGTRAQALAGLGQYDAAERDSLEVSARAAQAQGPQSFTAIGMNGLAGEIECRAGRAREGAARVQAAYETSRRTLGDAHPITRSMPTEIATCLVLDHREAEAKRYLEHIDCAAIGGLFGEADYCADVDVLRAAIARADGRESDASTLLRTAQAHLSPHPADPFYTQLAERLASAPRIHAGP